VTEPGTQGRSPLRAVLLAVIAVGLLLLGGGLSVAFGIGRSQAPATPTADSVDAGFARDMSHHHLQAVEMADLAADRSHDPAVRLMAFDIASTQNNQVGRMQGWLSLWGLPPSGGTPMSWMGGTMPGMPGMTMGSAADAAAGADTAMPGMASDAELTQLRSLTGTAFDVQFLRLMIRHHQGGRAMAQYGAAHGTVPALRRLATTIVETQTAEAQTLMAMLTARGGTPLPAP
jgi:uncharacterized protein (DUF305 family)